MSARKNISVIAGAIHTDAREAIALAQTHGFAGLVFDVVSGSLDLTALSSTGRREFKHVAASHGQTLVAIQCELGSRGLGAGADIDRILARLDAIFCLAGDLLAEHVTIDLRSLPSPPQTLAPTPRIAPEEAGLIIIPSPTRVPVQNESLSAVDPEVLSQIDTALAAVGELAERYRVSIALSSSLSGFAALDRAVTAARCPWFGVDLDPVAMLADRLSSDEIFSRVGGLVRHVRARDAALGAEHRTKPAEVGRGDVDWKSLLSSLDSAGYSGWLSIDPIELSNRQNSAQAGLKYLRSLM